MTEMPVLPVGGGLWAQSSSKGHGWPAGTGGVLPVAACRLLPTLPEAPV